jgi:hypothetical protein
MTEKETLEKMMLLDVPRQAVPPLWPSLDVLWLETRHVICLE